MLVPPKSATKQRGSRGPPPCEKIVTLGGLFLVLRMRAAREFIQVRIAFVAQFLDQPDLRRVVTVDRVALDRVEKLDANLIFKSRILPRRESHQECVLLLRGRVLEVGAEDLIALLVYPAQSPNEVPLPVFHFFAQHQ